MGVSDGESGSSEDVYKGKEEVLVLASLSDLYFKLEAISVSFLSLTLIVKTYRVDLKLY